MKKTFKLMVLSVTMVATFSNSATFTSEDWKDLGLCSTILAGVLGVITDGDK